MKTNQLLMLLFSFLLIISRTTQSSSNQTTNPIDQTEIANIKDDKSLESKIETLRNSMIHYMKTANPSYTEADVNKCVNILNEYLAKMETTNAKEEGMQVVKATILKLNTLNNNCGSPLIETSERESIAEIIIIAGNRKGYNSLEEDITEAWREW